LQAGTGRNVVPDCALLKVETRGITNQVNDDRGLGRRQQGISTLFRAATGMRADAGKIDVELGGGEFTAIHLGTGVPAGELVCGSDSFLATTKLDVNFTGPVPACNTPTLTLATPPLCWVRPCSASVAWAAASPVVTWYLTVRC
jgi:metal-dependent amidase/aminoacylase/carboxypeptidase family protein